MKKCEIHSNRLRVGYADTAAAAAAAADASGIGIDTGVYHFLVIFFMADEAVIALVATPSKRS